MKNYLGVDLNDDKQSIYVPSFNSDVSVNKQLDWSDYSSLSTRYNLDSVCV